MKESKISQSQIKDVLQGCCKHYYKKKYVDYVETEPTTAMMKGLYFESALLGASRGGYYEYPKLKNGNKSKAEQDIDAIVDLAREVLENSGITIDRVQECIETDDLIGHIDFASDKIYDVKYTGLDYDKWDREFIYRLNVDFEIQARHYQMIDGTGKDFVFLIFSEHGWFRAIVYPYTDNAIVQHQDYIDRFRELVTDLPEPTSAKCAGCPFKDSCEFRVKKFDFEIIHDIVP